MSELHALLIGIDGYLQGETSATGVRYACLPSSVADVTAVEDYLRQVFEVSRIQRLTASALGHRGEPPEPRSAWPTYENICAALARLADEAAPGDQIYIHYSGHGGVIPTCLEDVRGPRALDETLVPVDIVEPSARHLRDVELVYWLRRMADRGLFVTLLLDCCHAGGAMRGVGLVRGASGELPRGVPQPDLTPRDGPGVPTEQLRRAWGGRGVPGARDGREISALRAAEEWVVLAACRPTEQAWHIPKELGSHGALTWAWLAALRSTGPRVSYGELYERILAAVRRLPRKPFPQTPMLYGAAERQVFGKDRIPYASQVGVTEVEDDGSILLNTGPIQGVFEGTRFEVYPPGTTEIDTADRLAVVEVTELSAGDVRAQVVGAPPLQSIAPGARAVLVHPGGVSLQSAVRIEKLRGSLSAARIQEIEAGLDGDRSGFLRLAKDSSEPHDFELVTNDGGMWEIRDPWGEPIKFPKVPPISDDHEAIPAMVRRLIHLTKFRNLDRLINPDQESRLHRQLRVGWAGAVEPTRICLRAGETARLRVSNRSSFELNVTAVILRADGSVQWGILGIERGRFLLFHGREGEGEGESRDFEVIARPLPGVSCPVERIKIFGSTRGVANFGWLELPAWDGRMPPRPALRHDDPFELLLASLVGEWSAHREIVVTGMASGEWTVETVEIEVVPGPEPGVPADGRS